MSTYVPGFDCDVFISYAHVDNLKLGQEEDSLGWVHNLAADLKKLLAQKLGRQEWGKIWLDQRMLAGDLPLTPEIHQAVRHSATLLVILSEGYLQSAWCDQERALFLEAAAQSGGAEGRLFVVQLTEIERERWPEPFADLPGYEFFSKADPDGPARTLGIMADDPNNLCYAQRLDDLSRELSKRLQTLCKARVVPEDKRSAEPVTELPGPEIGVFLAETTPDMEDLRKNIKRHLEQVGLQVLPAIYYNRSPQAFEEAMRKDLAHCVLFVQLLGPYENFKTVDLPNGYEGLQLEQAKAAGKPVMRWHDPALAINSPRYLELLSSGSAMAMPFEDFKREVEQQARALAAKQKLDSQRDTTFIPSGAFALVNATQVDKTAADDICQALASRAIGYDLIDETTLLGDLKDDDIEIYNALLVIYGQCEPTWVQEQLRTCRKIALRRKQQAPVCAVYIGPPPDKEPLRTRPPQFYYFNDYREGIFKDFVTAVQTKAANQ